MADNYDLTTLLPTATLQQILQHYGCPSFSEKESYRSNAEDRDLYLHFYTGRVPTPAEFYYGVYIDRQGDTYTDTAVGLTSRYVGYVRLTNNGYEHQSAYATGVNMRMHGARWPEGETFTTAYSASTKTRCEPDSNADATWLLDWSFSAGFAATLSGGRRADLRSAYLSGRVVSKGPTWFALSSSPTEMYTSGKITRSRDNGSEAKAYLDLLQDGSPDRRPQMIGSVGELGSGADLELASGADSFSDTINLISLRVLGTDPA